MSYLSVLGCCRIESPLDYSPQARPFTSRSYVTEKQIRNREDFGGDIPIDTDLGGKG